MTKDILGHNLKMLRTDRGITLAEAEELTGVTQETLSALERGQRGAYTATLRKIADAYGIDLGDLLGGELTLVPAGKAEAPQAGLSEAGFTPNLADPSRGLEDIPPEVLRDTALQLSAGLKVNRTYESARAETREETVSRTVNLAAIKAIGEEFHRRGEEPPEQFILAYRQWLRATTPPPEGEAEVGHGSSEAG